MRPLTTVLLAALLSFPAFAQSEAPPPADVPAAAPALTPEPEKSAVSAADAGRRAARRERFEVHRRVGFATEAVMLGALAFYIVDDVNRFSVGGSRVKSFTVPTLALTATAEVGMLVNVLLALTAPPRKGATPPLTIVHQILMYAGAAANIARFVLGVALAGATLETADPGLLTAYRVTSIAAPVLFATGFTLKLF
jgi:hypothetical protein